MRLTNVFTRSAKVSCLRDFGSVCESAEPQLKNDLKEFFTLRDRKNVTIVDELFRVYRFQDIAAGIFTKYKLLPAGWRQELQNLKQHRDPSLKWFDPNAEIYLDEAFYDYLDSDRPGDLPKDERATEDDRVIDEFIEKEKAYYCRLRAFMTHFVGEVDFITSNSLGPKAMKALGINRRRFDLLFGRNLMNVLKSSENLVTALEVLVLVDAEPKIAGGRSAVLTEILMDQGEELVAAYAPFVAKHQLSKQVLQECYQQLKFQQPVVDAHCSHVNLVQLWTEISEAQSLLHNFSIDSILETPVKRFTNYKLFLERLAKVLPEKDPAKPKVKGALLQISKFIEQIDDAIRIQAADLNKFFAKIQKM